MNISLLLSGNLGFEILRQLTIKHKLKFVATDSKSHSIISYCQEHDIPLFIGNPRKGRLYDFARAFSCEVLLSINYLFLIESDVIDLFTYPINFHGSLLPKYRGRTPHIWAIINNEKVCGVTAHYIDSGCDTGEIVLQRIINIEDHDTGNDLLSKYVTVYPELVEQVIYLISSDKLERYPQDRSLATYYGKRTPDDGEIDWNWQKERIRNWVRALSYPYPGAYTFVGRIKMTIDQVEFSTLGYSNETPNGSIIQNEPFIIVKTPNGALSLKSIRDVEFKKSDLKDKILGNENR